MLDGEELRKKSSRKYGYSVEERIASSNEDIEIVKKYVNHGNMVIIATLSPQSKVRIKATILIILNSN